MNRKQIEAALLLAAYVGMVLVLMTYAYARYARVCREPSPWYCFKLETL